MASCAPFHDQILDFVYGLLEANETQALRAHLEACPTCQQELTETQGQQRLFARAALPVGADAVPAFAAPADDAPATLPFAPAATPAAPAASRRVRRRGLVLAWSAAAAVLVACGVLWHLYSQGRDTLEDVLAEQRQTVRRLDAKLAALEPAFKADAQALDRKLRAEAPLHVYAMAPAQLHPGGDEVVQVTVHDLDGQPVDARLQVALVDPAGAKVVARRSVFAAGGSASVPVSADSSAAPGPAAFQLVVEAAAGPATARLQETLKTAAPAYVAHLVTSKTQCRPGELLFYRALLLDRAGLTPPTAPVALRFVLTDAAGKTVADATATAEAASGVASGELALLETWPDGDYELRVTAAPGGPAVRPHARKVQIARGVTYDAQADQDLYRAGQVVKLGLPRAFAQARLEQKAMSANSAPDVKVLVNGQPVPLLNGLQGGPGNQANFGFQGGGGGAVPPMKGPAPGAAPVPPPGPPVPVAPSSQANFGFGGTTTSAANNASIGGYLRNDRAYPTNLQFALPNDLASNRVHVKVLLTEGKVQETFEHDLAVVPSALAVDFFPEGGELVAGVPNRVFYRVRSPRGEPVNPEGRVIVLSGTDVLFDSAPGQGAGSFTFTPKAGEVYAARITTPDSPTREFAYPFAAVGGVRTSGLVLHTPQAVAVENEPLQVVLHHAGAARRVLLVAECRGRLVGQQWVEAKGQAITVALGRLPGARGIVRLTAYQASGAKLKPVAERLIYRLPARRLDLAALHLGGIVAHGKGPKSVQLELRARDQDGQPVPTWALAAVIDERFRGREPSPLAHFFIAGEVRSGADLDDAALLAADTPATRQALDLFLGTAGWRRFAPAASAEATFLARENASPQALQAQHEAHLEEALIPIRLAIQHEQASLGAAQQTARAALDRARAELRDHEARPEAFFRIGLGVATLCLLGVAVMALALGAGRLLRRHQATPWFAGAFACMALCLVTTLVLSSLAPPTQTTTAELAQGPRDNPMDLLGRLNFPHRVEAPDGPPAGDFTATTERRQSANKDTPLADPARKLDESPRGLAGMKRDRQQDGAGGGGFSATTANEPQGQVAGKGRGAGLAPEIARRFQKAAQEQLTRLAKAPGALATTPVSNPALKAGPDERPQSKAEAKHGTAKEAGATRSGVFYAYHFQPGLEPDTLLWDPALFLPSGSTQVTFDVPAAGAYRVLLFGHTADGRLGFYEGYLEVQPDLAR